MYRAKLRRGQALVMVTFSLVAMIGVVGLAVDFSSAYFLEKTMQAAADTAALAAVQKAKEVAGGSAGISCGNAYCGAATLCSSITGTATAGCQYAAQNGFTAAEVSIAANAASSMVADGACTPAVKHPPTAGCVSTLYWATVRVSRRVPQLFSAILGRSEGGVSARATAAVAEVTFEGSLIVINRTGDIPVTGPGIPSNINGTNVDVQGGGTLTIPGGIILGSSSIQSPREAGRIQGNSLVVSPFTFARASSPNVIGGNQQNWQCGPPGFCAPTVVGDGTTFQDPFHVKSVNGDIGGQPPIYGPGQSAANDTLKPVIGGILTNSICPSGVCPPGIYYAVEPDCNGCLTYHPSGGRIRSNNNATLQFSGSSFDRYIFVGGLNLQGGSDITLGPGRYVFAGVMNPADAVFETANSVALRGGNISDAGRVLIFTDFRKGDQRNSVSPAADVDSYANQIDGIWSRIQADYPSNWNLNPWASNGLRHGSVDIKAGNNASSLIQLSGLRPSTNSVPAELMPYGRVAMWQDQHNSYVWYKQNGQVDMACGGQNSPCPNTPDSPTAPKLSIAANANTQYDGVIYQPRGAWTDMQGSTGYNGSIQIVSGAIMLGGGGSVNMTGLSDPISTFKVALVE